MEKWLRNLILEIILVALCVALAFTANGFFTTYNFFNILLNVSIQGIIAFGMTMVIIVGEIDLSVGSMVGFAGCLTAWLIITFTGKPAQMPLAPAVLLAMLISVLAGLLCGGITGLLRVRFRVPTFISTLAWMTILRGASGLLTHGSSLTPFPKWYIFLGSGRIAGIPFPVLVFLLLFLIIHFLMMYTAFGRSVYAVGGNADAARLSGINVSAVKISVMIIVAVLAVIAGILQSAQGEAGSQNTGAGWELDIIAAVIIGGTSLTGGAGRVWGTLIGIIFLGVLVNGMTLLKFPEEWQYIIRGTLILIAALINQATIKNRSS